MLSVTILTVGKLKEGYLRDACGEYAKRLQGSCTFRIEELNEYRLPENPSPAQIALGLEKEGQEILQRCPAGAYVVAMCIEGKMLDSVAFSRILSQVAVQGKSQVIFIIGGSFGLWERVKKRADLRLSMSPMTFPHQLARVMLCEQIYRAFSIAAGTRYHK